MIMVQLAKLAGASTVILSEVVEAKRTVGLKIGADFVIDPMNENIHQKIKQILGTDGVDNVIECVGNLTATGQAFDSAKRGASLLLFSVPKAESVYGLKMEDIYQKELRIMGSMINPDTHQRAVNMINNHRLDLKSIITHYYPHQQLKEAILIQMSNQSLKVIVSNMFKQTNSRDLN